MKRFSILPILLLLLACGQSNRAAHEKKPLLQANREAPLGWVYLSIYADSSFEFTLTGLRDRKVFPGTVSLLGDTLLFSYSDSVPDAGTKAIISGQSVAYLDGAYPECVGITYNQLVPK